MSASTLDTDSTPLLLVPASEVALAGIRTPFSGGSITGPATQDVAVLITARTGSLAADLLPGVTVSGGGSTSLWIAGPLAQVNAALATLAYVGSQAGTDALTVTLVDPPGQGPGPIDVPVTILPLIAADGVASPAVTILGGTMTLESQHIDGVTINLDDAHDGAGPATLVLDDSTLGATVTLTVATSDVASPAPRLAMAGNVEFDGQLTFETGPALVTLAQNAVLTNLGQIDFNASWAQVIGAGTLDNDGMLTVWGGATGQGPAVDVAIAGTGDIQLAAGAQLELGATVSAGQTISFQDGTGTLVLGAPADMQAQIAGFVAGDTIQLGEIATDAAGYTQTADGGTLTLYDGSQVAATLSFAGAYQLDDFIFSVATDSASDGGAITSLSVRALPGATGIAAADSTDVYRFFDTTNGTQLLTQDPAERDAILASRPDMIFEDVAMKAVASAAADPAAVAVYRFFDVANGTHFFTDSDAERANLVATRPDLVFEPNSTMLEDATPQPGDVAVYRLFDSTTGTHFFTDSAAERASVLATHAEMKNEGIAFYAPAH